MKPEKTVIIVMSHTSSNVFCIEAVVTNIRQAVPVVERIISEGKAWSLAEKQVDA